MVWIWLKMKKLPIETNNKVILILSPVYWQLDYKLQHSKTQYIKHKYHRDLLRQRAVPASGVGLLINLLAALPPPMMPLSLSLPSNWETNILFILSIGFTTITAFNCLLCNMFNRRWVLANFLKKVTTNSTERCQYKAKQKNNCRRWCWIKRGGRCQVAILTWCCDDGGLGGHYPAESIFFSCTVLYCIVLYYPVLSCWERIIIPLKARLNHPQTSKMHAAQMPPTDPVIKHQNGKCLNLTCVMHQNLRSVLSKCLFCRAKFRSQI